MGRIFVYDDREYPDPDPSATPEEVRTSLSALLPELANAEIKASKRPAKSGEGEDDIFELKRRVGTKGDGEEETETEEPEPEDKNPEPAENKAPEERTDELKVVIVFKAGKALVGVLSPSCDPVYETITGDMSAALETVPGLIEKANQQWDAHPRYPEANLPKPEPAPVTTRPARTPEKPTSQPQPSFF